MTGLSYHRDGFGLPVVLVHTGFLDHRMWSETHRALSATYDVISYDVRGAGASERADGPHSPSEDLAALLDEVGIERAAIVGLSMGARIAFEFSAMHPNRTSAAVLCSLALPEYVTSDCNGMLPRFIQALTDHDISLATELFTRMWFDGRRASSAIDTERRAQFVDLIDFNFAAAFVHQRWRTLVDLGPLEELRTPTLFLTGHDDWPDIHATVAAIERRIPNSMSVSLDGAAHTLNFDRPDELLRHIDQFLSAHTAPTTGLESP